MVHIIKTRRKTQIPPVETDEARRIDRTETLTVRIPEAVRMTGIGRSKLYELIQSGDIGIVKIGASTLIPVDSLRELIARNRRQ
jgi:excisionase family DNA binding protein